MVKTSAGILLYRIENGKLQVLLAHPGGPFWAKKEYKSWSIPKGGIEDSEPPLVAARREFFEETGKEVDGEFIPLTPLKQPSGKKVVHAWALKGDFDASALRSNMFSMEWPKNSGTPLDFPEIDKVGWFDVTEARQRILAGQWGFVEELQATLIKRGELS
jgi:predicted NUDIX family NTP pyrophosphohydrolase